MKKINDVNIALEVKTQDKGVHIVIDTRVKRWPEIKRNIMMAIDVIKCCVCGTLERSIIKPSGCCYEGWICIVCMLKYYQSVGKLDYQKCFICNRMTEMPIIVGILKLLFGPDYGKIDHINEIAHVICEKLDEIIEHCDKTDTHPFDYIKEQVLKPRE